LALHLLETVGQTEHREDHTQHRVEHRHRDPGPDAVRDCGVAPRQETGRDVEERTQAGEQRDVRPAQAPEDEAETLYQDEDAAAEGHDFEEAHRGRRIRTIARGHPCVLHRFFLYWPIRP